MKLDILALMAHPDDAELGCAGTLISHVNKGYKAGVIDYTQGELGTRGTIETRKKEAEEASKIMKISHRGNLKFRDGFFQNDEAHQLKVIEQIRRFTPEIVIANAIQDRHPDHAKGAQLTVTASFLSGLSKIETFWEGKAQEAWRPAKIYHIIQSRFIEPDFSVDVSEVWEEKMKSIYAYKTQFHTNDETSGEGSQTFISTPDFVKFIEGRARELGKNIGVEYAEGFTKAQPLGVSNLFELIQ